jgi:hypothetical protein
MDPRLRGRDAGGNGKIGEKNGKPVRNRNGGA